MIAPTFESLRSGAHVVVGGRAVEVSGDQRRALGHRAGLHDVDRLSRDTHPEQDRSGTFHLVSLAHPAGSWQENSTLRPTLPGGSVNLW
jgi:hypothetical protein